MSFAKNASAGIALSCNSFITVMETTEVRNLHDPSGTRDLTSMRTIPQEIARSVVLGEGLDNLLRRPGRGGVVCHVEVQHPTNDVPIR